MSSRNNSIKLQLLWENGRRCAICGKKIRNLDELTVDHIVPKSKGGRHTIDNCQLAHKSCNSLKNDKMPEEFEKALRYNRKRVLIMRIRKGILFW
ncbi:HNH endonuclease [Candidatus Saccharibacteria bacterium]|nr:HNH endonuclease [Candidatus Saccharibacteria bacterium]